MRVSSDRRGWAALLLFVTFVVAMGVTKIWIKRRDAALSVEHSVPVAARRALVQQQHEDAVATVTEPTPVTQPRIRKLRLAIILCKFLGKAVETRPRRFYEDYYTRAGTGGMSDYWRDVTLGSVELSTRSPSGGGEGWPHARSRIAVLHGLRRAPEKIASQVIDLHCTVRISQKATQRLTTQDDRAQLQAGTTNRVADRVPPFGVRWQRHRPEDADDLLGHRRFTAPLHRMRSQSCTTSS